MFCCVLPGDVIEVSIAEPFKTNFKEYNMCWAP